MKLYLYENLLSERFVEKRIDNTKNETYGQIFDELNLVGSFLIIETDEIKRYPQCYEDAPACGAVVHVKRVPKKDGTAFGYIFGALQVVAGAVLTCFGVGAVGIPLMISGAGSVTATAVGQIFKGPNVPDQKDMPKGKEQYGLQGAKNRVSLGSKYPVIFGTHIITPPLAAAYYTELSDSSSGRGDMYLYGLLCVGYKELSVKNVQFGLNPVVANKDDVRNGFIAIDGNFEGQLEIRQDGTYPQLYGYKHYEEHVNAEITKTDVLSMQTRFTPKKTTKITSIVSIPGLYKMNDKGDLDPVSVDVVMAYRKRGAGIWNYIETEKSYTVFPFPYTFKVVGVERKKVSPGVRFQFSTADTLRFEITKEFSAAELNANPDGDWEAGIYRTSAASGDIKVKDRVYWTTIRSKIDERPVIESELSKLCLLAFKIKATEVTNGALDQLNCTASSVLPVYNGTDWDTYKVSSNPASAYLYCLRGNFLPQKADIETIDLRALEALYYWCDSNDYKCDGIISNGEPLRNILNKILATCRAAFYIKSGLYSLICDKEKSSPIALLTPKNSRDFTASKSFAKVPKALEITYNDASNNYTPKNDTVLLHGESIDTEAGDVTEKLSIWGVTDYNQIVKLGRYFLAVARNRPERYNITVSIEHFGLPVGERVLLQHDVLLVGLAGGFIKSVDHVKKTIQIDEVQVLDSTKHYAVEIFKQDGNIIFLPVKVSSDKLANGKNTNGMPADTFETGGDLTGVCEDDIYAFGIKDKIVEDCLIDSKVINQSPGLSAELSLIPYAPEVFDAPAKPVPPYDPKTTARNGYSFVAVKEKQQGENPNNGASVQDDGGIFFDFGSYSVCGNKIVNRGSTKSLGDGVFKSVSFEVSRNKNYAVVNPSSQVELNVDTLLFRNSSVTFWIKDLKDEGYVFSYVDCEGGNRHQMRYKEGKLILTIQNEHINTIPIDASKESMITVVNDYSSGSLAVYIDTTCHAKHGTLEAEAAAKSSNAGASNLADKNKNKMTPQKLIVYGKVNRDIAFYLFAGSGITIEEAKAKKAKAEEAAKEAEEAAKEAAKEAEEEAKEARLEEQRKRIEAKEAIRLEKRAKEEAEAKKAKAEEAKEEAEEARKSAKEAGGEFNYIHSLLRRADEAYKDRQAEEAEEARKRAEAKEAQAAKAKAKAKEAQEDRQAKEKLLEAAREAVSQAKERAKKAREELEQAEKARSFCGKAAQFRIFGWALNEQDVIDIYENSRLLINTAAETRYIGEFVNEPKNLNLYDTFKYAGETNDTFLKDKKYALVQNGYQIWEN